jgi:hypothetical protein
VLTIEKVKASPYACHKSIWSSGGIPPYILNLGTWMCGNSCPATFFQGKGPHVSIEQGNGVRYTVGMDVEEKKKFQMEIKDVSPC